MYIELNDELAPILVENFIHYCHNNEDELSFVGMSAHRNTIGNHLLLQMPIARTKFGAYFPNKNEWHCDLRHKKGVLSYQSAGNIITGHWTIFYGEQPLQDAIFAPFGKVVEQSFPILDQLEATGTKNDRPLTEHTIVLVKCEMIDAIPVL